MQQQQRPRPSPPALHLAGGVDIGATDGGLASQGALFVSQLWAGQREGRSAAGGGGEAPAAAAAAISSHPIPGGDPASLVPAMTPSRAPAGTRGREERGEMRAPTCGPVLVYQRGNRAMPVPKSTRPAAMGRLDLRAALRGEGLAMQAGLVAGGPSSEQRGMRVREGACAGADCQRVVRRCRRSAWQRQRDRRCGTLANCMPLSLVSGRITAARALASSHCTHLQPCLTMDARSMRFGCVAAPPPPHALALGGQMHGQFVCAASWLQKSNCSLADLEQHCTARTHPSPVGARPLRPAAAARNWPVHCPSRWASAHLRSL